MNIRTIDRILVIGAIAALAAVGGRPRPPNKLSDVSHPSARIEADAESHSSPVGLPNFAAIVAENSASVVNVSVGGTTEVALRVPDAGASQFGDAPSAQPGPGAVRSVDIPVRGVGSGFVLRADGLIVTNAHVVDGASEITVRLANRREYSADLVGIDLPTDLALLRIHATDLPAVRVGDSSRTSIGDWVLAIGSPFGFDHSVTAGIVSAKARTLPDENFVSFIQTDVAVNPGNSGGPLFNLAGEVIGINSQFFSKTGGYQGLSFAIPIDLAINVARELMRDGKVTRGQLGISVQEVDQALAESFGFAEPRGALVDTVKALSPAARAGVRPGDIVVAIDGRKVSEFSDLQPIIAELRPGAHVKLALWRDGTIHELSAEVGTYEDPAGHAEHSGELGHNALGLAVRPLSADESRRLDVAGGVVVEQSVESAAKAGIQPGDVILGLNGHPVTEARQLRDLLDTDSRHVALLVQRGVTRMFVALDLS
ncbi:MAG: Do family serine endopeptidase [Methylotetracoccus sp.]